MRVSDFSDFFVFHKSLIGYAAGNRISQIIVTIRLLRVKGSREEHKKNGGLGEFPPGRQQIRSFQSIDALQLGQRILRLAGVVVVQRRRQLQRFLQLVLRTVFLSGAAKRHTEVVPVFRALR
jgi:hypothetical protein